MRTIANEEDVNRLTDTLMPGPQPILFEGLITAAVRRRPHAILLLSWIEHAHAAACRLIQQILEQGWIEDARGRVTFEHTIVFATSRVPEDENGTASEIGFNRAPKSGDDRVREKLTRRLGEEFLESFQEVIVVPALSPDDVRKIARYKVETVLQRLEEGKRGVKVSESVYQEFITDEQCSKTGRGDDQPYAREQAPEPARALPLGPSAGAQPVRRCAGRIPGDRAGGRHARRGPPQGKRRGLVTVVRAAIFGNGFARSVVLPCLRHVPSVRVVGIASPNLERVRATAAEFGIEAVSDDHRVILERCRPDLVFVVTPPHRHREQAIDALEAGCHVVCEKPTALDGTESAAMLAAARAHPKQLALIDHELRFSPARVALREMVREGRLGTIHHATFTLLSPGRRDPSTPWTWWSDRACGGGALGAIGSHAVDSLRVLLGEVVETRGLLETFVRERPDPSTGRPRPVTTDDFAAALAAVRIRRDRDDHDLAGRGRAGPPPDARGFGWLRAHRGAAAAADPDRPRSAGRVAPGRRSRAVDGVGHPRHRLGALLPPSRPPDGVAIRDGRTEVPGAATFEDGHRNQVVLDAARSSAVTDSAS